MGIGATQSFIPVDAITGITPDEVHVNVSRERIASEPRYDPPLSDEPGFYESICTYYGIAPFWYPVTHARAIRTFRGQEVSDDHRLAQPGDRTGVTQLRGDLRCGSARSLTEPRRSLERMS